MTTSNTETIRVGYMIGIKEDGDLFFNIIGTNPGLIELQGLVTLAAQKVEEVRQQKTMGGDILLQEVKQAVTLMNKKVDKLEAAITAYFTVPSGLNVTELVTKMTEEQEEGEDSPPFNLS